MTHFLIRKMSQTFKIVLMGDAAVGKSAIVQRMANKKFTPNYIRTIGLDFISIEIASNNAFSNTKLQLWDTAGGQECFKFNTQSYSRGADAIFFVYDLTDKESFDHLDTLIPEVQKQCNPNTLCYLVGNKSDKSDRVITHDERFSFAVKYSLNNSYEVSAKDNNNIEMMFHEIIKRLVSRSTPVDEKDIIVEEINAELSSICEKLATIGQRLKSLKDKN